MGHSRVLHIILTGLICLVWFVNGFFCKILDMAPRHQEIVARILGEEDAWLITKFIGVAEVLMTFWILANIQRRFCAIVQMFIVAIMNILEFALAPDLLLFGKLNLVFAFLFIMVIYINEFHLNKGKTYAAVGK